jgi:hypothetical protein
MALYLDASLRRTAVSDVVVPRTYIRSREFDITLLAAPIVAGLATALMVAADSRLYPIAIYFVPIYGIAQRSATMGDRFLGLPVTPLVVPEPLLILLGFAAAAAVLAWIVRILRAAFNDTLDLQYTGFVASHIVIFLVAYVGMEDVNTGWLAINVWHNFQYVLVVWMSNAKRYAGGIDPAARFLSRLSQPERVMKYFACCLAIATLLYAAIDRLTVLALGGGMAATIGVYMGLNFHHHIVNALIWKRRKAVPQG